MPSGNIRWQPAIYEHKAALIGRKPIEVACDAELFTQALLKEYEVYGADFLTVGLDVYNIEADVQAFKAALGDDTSIRVRRNISPAALERGDIKTLAEQFVSGRKAGVLEEHDFG